MNTNIPPDFLVHDAGDSVGVIVVEGVTAGSTITGWVMENDNTIQINVLDDIPLGHKVALFAISDGDTITKYNESMGKAVASIGKGHHVHVHNCKTKKW